MNPQDIHARARRLILDRSGSALEPEEGRWLDVHLDECPGCERYAALTRKAVMTLRTASEMPPPALVRATQQSVRFAARNLGEMASQRRMLIVSCVLAAGWGMALQPYIWRVFGWVGASLGVPGPVWQAFFIVTWIVPGVVSVLLLAHMPLPSWTRQSFKRGKNV